MNDLTNMIFKAPVGGKLSYAEQALQSNAINLMMQRTGLQPETGKKTKVSPTTSCGRTTSRCRSRFAMPTI